MISSGIIGVLPVLLAGVTGSGLILSNSRIVRLGLLALQYLAAAWLITGILPATIAAVKLVAGLLACGILALTIANLPDGQAVHSGFSAIPAGRWFRSIAIFLVMSASYGLAQTDWLGIPNLSREATLAATILMGLGLLQIGISNASLRIGTGLMTLVSGFEIPYAAVEPSLAVLALQGSLHLGFALVMSFLLLAGSHETELQDPAS